MDINKQTNRQHKTTDKQATQDNIYQLIPPKGTSDMGLLKQKRALAKLNSQRDQNSQTDSNKSVNCEQEDH